MLKKAVMFCWKRIIRRALPHTWLSWRFFLPLRFTDCSAAFLLHRRVFFNAWVGWPRIIYLLIVVYSCLLWYLFFGPLYYWRAVRARKKHATLEQGLSWRSIVCAYGRGIAPSSFFALKLYQQDPADWWLYVGNELLPHWHQVLQPKPNKHDAMVIGNKASFARFVVGCDLPAIEGGTVDADFLRDLALGLYPEVFLKPAVSSQAKGCLFIESINGAIALRSKDGSVQLVETDAVASYVSRLAQHKPYVWQKLLKSHTMIAPYQSCDDLAVVRIVTVRSDSDEIMVLRANIELPKPNNVYVTMHRIENDSGLVGTLEPVLQLPCWADVVAQVKRAHLLLPSLMTVGWDVAITDDGVFLIEGNLNWGTTAMQIGEHGALLSDERYVSALWLM